MTLNFPFRNITINEFWDYFERAKVSIYSEIKENPNSWRKEYFYEAIEIWKEGLASFENEILQTINTTNQETIDEYFKQTYYNLESLHNHLSVESFKEKIKIWNNEILNEFSEQIEKESEKFFLNKKTELKHLEEYEELERQPFFFQLPILSTSRKKVKKTNYNFYCVEKKPELISIQIAEDYFALIDSMFEKLVEIIKKYYTPWKNGELVSKVEEKYIPKPIIFLEGDHDITYIKRAAELLDKSGILDKVELRQREGFRNLDKLWIEINKESWETVPQTKIFLYDCDTLKVNEDFGHHFKRIIPTLEKGIVKTGIENLFPEALISRAIKEKKAFIDFKTESGIKRGVEYKKEFCEVNKDEKKNFCDWACENGTKEDFDNFNIIFEIIESLI